ncbi:MAG: hypothetical protein N2109_09605 [Fimbriimonadales bacterium]|nr:hypothetical protein [Fimbriimonadales bacterium]
MNACVLASTLATTLWMPSAQDTIEVRRVLRQGDTQTFVVRIELERGEAVSSVESRVQETVEQVDSNGRATIRTRYLSVRIGGSTAGNRPDDRTLVGPDGAILSIFSNDAEAFRLARAIAITGVLSASGPWSLEQPASSQPLAPPARTQYTFEGTEALGSRTAARIRFEFREQAPQSDPLQALGRYWLEVGSGRLLRLEAELTGLPGMQGTDAKARVSVRAEEG